MSDMSGNGSFRFEPIVCNAARLVGLGLCRELFLCAFLFRVTSTFTGFDRDSAEEEGCDDGSNSSVDMALSGPAENWNMDLELG